MDTHIHRQRCRYYHTMYIHIHVCRMYARILTYAYAPYMSAEVFDHMHIHAHIRFDASQTHKGEVSSSRGLAPGLRFLSCLWFGKPFLGKPPVHGTRIVFARSLFLEWVSKVKNGHVEASRQWPGRLNCCTRRRGLPIRPSLSFSLSLSLAAASRAPVARWPQARGVRTVPKQLNVNTRV